MKLLDLESNVAFEAEVFEVLEKDFQKIKASGQFQFDWSKEKGNSIFKITEVGDEKILGLLSLVDYPSEFRVHLNLIENAADHKGRNKKIDRIAGCLIAFAAQIAFEKGYLGFVSLTPKTELIDLYIHKFGFQQRGRMLALETRNSIELIQKFL